MTPYVNASPDVISKICKHLNVNASDDWTYEWEYEVDAYVQQHGIRVNTRKLFDAWVDDEYLPFTVSDCSYLASSTLKAVDGMAYDKLRIQHIQDHYINTGKLVEIRTGYYIVLQTVRDDEMCRLLLVDADYLL